MASEFDNIELLKMMRYSLWERIKGELRSLYELYYDSQSAYDEMTEEVENFIIEFNELVYSAKRRIS